MNSYNINKLTENEAKKLIKAEKFPDDIMNFNDVFNQIVNTILDVEPGIYSCRVHDFKNQIIYNMINRQSNKRDKFSICLMFENNLHLIRFDFGSKDELKHKNDWKTAKEHYVKGSHVHILANSNKYVPKNVIPIDNINGFRNLKTMKDAFQEAIKYLNIKKVRWKNEC